MSINFVMKSKAILHYKCLSLCFDSMVEPKVESIIIKEIKIDEDENQRITKFSTFDLDLE